MRYLDNSVTYSTVNLSIDEVDIESPTQPETAWQQIQRGFTRNLISLMDNLTRFFISLLSNLPVILFPSGVYYCYDCPPHQPAQNRKNTKTTEALPDFFHAFFWQFPGNFADRHRVSRQSDTGQPCTSSSVCRHIK